jgi:Phytanoyl-CoA dioxygenase (PhyH)
MQVSRLSTAISPLSATEVAIYSERGQLTPRWRLRPELLARLRAVLEQLLAARPEVRPDFIPLPHVPWHNSPQAESIAREFFQLISDPELLDVVEQLIGPDIILWASAMFCKPPTTGLEVPWHQDGQYWPIEPRATVTMWIALDHVSVANGCMKVIPGSHRLGDFSHDTSDREDLVLNNVLNDPRLDLSTAYDIELEPGQVSLHDVNIVHGSQPNRSGQRRAGYAVRYMPATAHYNRQSGRHSVSALAPIDFANRPIWLLRGTDRCGRNDFVTGHPDR